MAKIASLTTLLTNFSSIAALNANFTKIVTAFDNTLSRDGSTPNTMSADLDLNSNNLLNAANISFLIPVFVKGKPAAGDVELYYSTVQGFTLPSGAGSHTAEARVASTGTAIFDVLRNDASIGSITFAASTTGVFAISPATTFVVSDTLSITAPGSQDTTLEDIAITFKGTP